MGREPRIHEKYPIRESLSPPLIAGPVYECAEAVYVSGFVPHATVRVFADVNEQLAEITPQFGFANVVLNRPVSEGEKLTATQAVGMITSAHLDPPVIVVPLPDGLVANTKPVVHPDLYECGIVVPADNLVPGMRVHVDESGTEVGVEPAAQAWHPVVTSPLHAAAAVTARQIACEGTGHEVEGPWSDAVSVKAAPSPTPAPGVHPDSLIVGNDTVTLTSLLVGAGAEIFDQGTSVSAGWYATGPASWFPIDPPLSSGSSITATQELCGNVSAESDPVKPHSRLKAPEVVGPICEGNTFVVVRETIVNATVVVMRNGSVAGYAGAAPGDLIVALGGNASLNAGDTVKAIQYMGETISPDSNTVTVVGSLEQPLVTILGGEPFFNPKPGEQPLDGPVFPRGRGLGPDIRIQACCSENVRVAVTDPRGDMIAELSPYEVLPGYFSVRWPWTSTGDWEVPSGIPVGRYHVVVQTDCDQKEAEAPFYVIFDPASVGGPPRFSFDDTTVWFGARTNAVVGLHYYLHPSDKRVFSIAIDAAGGHTDSYAAAVDVARAEEGLFGYSLNYHTKDVVDLLEHHNEAQCADDACCLTALLRAVGIPAHPVSADAGLETGAADWTFDTWTEFLAHSNGSTEWRILHPHEYPGMQPESRSTFGTTRGVATKSFNDLVIMANEQWVWADLDDDTYDVVYARNSCQEPHEEIAKAPWIDELCENGYWTTPHWDCSTVRSRGLERRSARGRGNRGFTLDAGDLRFGGVLEGTLELANEGDERRFGRLVVELVTNHLESKAFPEDSFDSTTARVVLDSRESVRVPFRLALPETIQPGRELLLHARFGDRTAALQKIRLPALLEASLTEPPSFRLGETSTVTVSIRAVSRAPLQGVEATLDVPFALSIEGDKSQYVRSLSLGEGTRLSWKVRANAPLRSGSFKISIATANGGGAQVRQPFRIVGGPVEVGLPARPRES